MGIDPKLQWCKCGYCWTPTLLQKMIMLVKGSYVKNCPICQRQMRLVLVYHVVKVETKVNKEKEKVWRNG